MQKNNKRVVCVCEVKELCVTWVTPRQKAAGRTQAGVHHRKNKNPAQWCGEKLEWPEIEYTNPGKLVYDMIRGISEYWN